MGIPADRQAVRWSGTRLFRMKDGRLVEGWINLDMLGLMQQLGVIPTPPPGPPAPATRHITGSPSTREANHALMERFIDEVWNKGNLAVADELFHPEASSPSAPTLPLGAEGVKFIVNMMRNAFSDYWMEITHIVAEDDRVAARFRQGGTHDGDLMGIAPTGKKVEWTEIGILRIADGKVVESWYDVDMLGLMGQLGCRRVGELTDDDGAESSIGTTRPPTPASGTPGATCSPTTWSWTSSWPATSRAWPRCVR